MKITYKFADGTVSIIEIPEEWGEVVLSLDREEYNNNRAETRRHSSIDEIDPDGVLLSSDLNVERETIQKLEREALLRAITMLEPRQQYLIAEVFFNDRTYAAIAKEEGKDESAIRHAVGRALKQLKKLLKNS